jgi:hypothetical protein
MEVADVDALALVGGGLLVEPVPAAATCAAHDFLPVILSKSLGKFNVGCSLSVRNLLLMEYFRDSVL